MITRMMMKIERLKEEEEAKLKTINGTEKETNNKVLFTQKGERKLRSFSDAFPFVLFSEASNYTRKIEIVKEAMSIS